MIELLFIEIGAILTEVRGSLKCTIEPFCSPALPPTYKPERRVEVDFTRSLDNIISSGTLPADIAQQALYDQLVVQMPIRRVALGPSWPGGGYEGIVSVREDVVMNNDLLAAAASSLAGPRCKYQVVATIDPGGTVRRYHGFHAELLRIEGSALILKLTSRAGEITYDPNADDASGFYTGGLVDGNVLGTGRAPGYIGGLFLSSTVSSALSADEELPKLPPSAGL